MGDSSFFVDLMIDFSVDVSDGAPVDVELNNFEATTFTVTNNSNDTVSFDLSAGNSALTAFNTTVDETGNAAPRQMGTFTIWTAGTNATWDNGTGDDVEITSSGIDLNEGETSETIYVMAQAPTTGVEDDKAVVYLQAQAMDDNYTTTLNEDAQANTYNAYSAYDDDVIVVHAEDPLGVVANLTEDDTGTGGDNGNGQAMDTSAFNLLAAALTLTKTHSIIDDTLGDTIYEVPGAEIEYTIVIENNGSADADDVYITDAIDSSTTYVFDNPLTADSGATAADLVITPYAGAQNASSDGACEGAAGTSVGYVDNPGDTSTDDATADGFVYNDGTDTLELFSNGSGTTIPGGECITIQYRVTID